MNLEASIPGDNSRDVAPMTTRPSAAGSSEGADRPLTMTVSDLSNTEIVAMLAANVRVMWTGGAAAEMSTVTTADPSAQ